jgi:hypothetical protein
MRGSFVVQLKELAEDIANVAQSRIEPLKQEIEQPSNQRLKQRLRLIWLRVQQAKLPPSRQSSADSINVLIAGSDETFALP